MSDTLHGFLFDGLPVRGQVVHLERAFADAVLERGYEATTRQLLGEMLAATSLLANLLREGDLTLQARGDGPVRVAMAECHGRDGLRAIARSAADARTTAMRQGDPVAPLDVLLGGGVLALTIRPQQGELQQSIVALRGVSLAGCLEHYFETSEQLPTRLWLTASDATAGGLLLQRLPLHPQASEIQVLLAERAWQQVSAAAAALTADELLRLPAAALLLHLFPAMDVRLLPPRPLHFRCRCSRARREQTLLLLGRQAVEESLSVQRQLAMTCEFCGTGYRFSADDARRLFVPAA